METPLRKNMNDARNPRYVQSMMTVRRRVEPVIGQLVERFQIEKVWVRDLWHLINRLTRNFLAHTVVVYLNCTQNPDPLQLERLGHCMKLSIAYNHITSDKES